MPSICASPAVKMATSASSGPTSRCLRHASNASLTSADSRQNSSGTSVRLKPLATLLAQAAAWTAASVLQPCRTTSCEGWEQRSSWTWSATGGLLDRVHLQLQAGLGGGRDLGPGCLVGFPGQVPELQLAVHRDRVGQPEHGPDDDVELIRDHPP